MFDHPTAGTVRDMALAAAVGAGVLLGGAGFAAAETQSFFLEREGPEPVSASTTLSFQQFNPALGTLTGVTVAYGYDEAPTFLTANVGIQGGEFGVDTISASASAVLSLNYANGTLALGSTAVASAECTTDGEFCSDYGDSFFLSSPVTPNPIVLTQQGDLDLFTGLGLVDIEPVLDPTFETTVNTPNTQVYIASHYASWGGTVRVTYNYQITREQPPVSTPEPASLALLGSALGLAGLLRRRRGA